MHSAQRSRLPATETRLPLFVDMSCACRYAQGRSDGVLTGIVHGCAAGCWKWLTHAHTRRLRPRPIAHGFHSPKPAIRAPPQTRLQRTHRDSRRRATYTPPASTTPVRARSSRVFATCDGGRRRQHANNAKQMVRARATLEHSRRNVHTTARPGPPPTRQST